MSGATAGVFLVIIAVFHGCGCVPRPCPQFLPVAIRVDQQQPEYRPNTFSLKTLVRVTDDQENFIAKNEENNLLVHQNGIPSEAPQLLRQSTSTPPVKSQKPKKRRRLRPKEPKNLILNPNSSWALKTINDRPAEEVLRTDKASVARDLKDATESALVTVKRLEDQK